MLSLPVEVEERVIDFVGAYFGLSNERNLTLGQSCMATGANCTCIAHYKLPTPYYWRDWVL